MKQAGGKIGVVGRFLDFKALEYRKQMIAAEKDLVTSVSRVTQEAQEDPKSFQASVAQQKYDPKLVNDFIKAASLVVGQRAVVASE